MRSRPGLYAALAALLVAGHARAATFDVTTTADSGPGSLRQAIADANVSQDSDTIHITANGTIQLASALPDLQYRVAIVGPGAANLTVRRDAASAFRIFIVRAAVNISGITIANGGADPSGNGGGVFVKDGSLELTDVVVSGSTAANGAAIYFIGIGSLTIARSTLSGNSGGSVVYVIAPFPALTDTTIANNAGSALVSPSAAATLTLDRCTLSSNTATSGVGGVQVEGGAAIVRDSTFSGNTGPQAGDFWIARDGVSLTVRNVTSVGSSSPAFLWDRPASVSMWNTIFSGMGARCSLGARTFTQGNNLSSDASCSLTDATDKPGTEPVLGPLADNGGFTKTHALLSGSPAINAGSNIDVSTTDQRGAPRIGAGTVDIGAYESGVTAPDAGASDAAAPDAAAPEAGPPESSTDAGTSPDAGDDIGGGAPADNDGCGCLLAGNTSPLETGHLVAAAAFALVMFARRRRSLSPIRP